MKFNNRNVLISPKSQIGHNVRIGDNTTIFDNVIIGDNTVISNNCQIGEPLTNFYFNDEYENPNTVIGENCLIRSYSTIYAGNKIGSNLTTGHYIMIRANNQIGNNCSIGNYTELHGDAILGNYIKLHSNVCVCEHSKIHDFVFIFPGSILSNGATPPSNELFGPEICMYSIIAVNAVILPGVKIGENCLIGANSVVTKRVDDFSLMIGNPAVKKGDVRDIKSKEHEGFHYPWMYNFERGMPWEGIGYEDWLHGS